MHEISLRDYQAHAINLLRDSLRSHGRSVLQMATGSGKTRTAAAICQRAINNGKRVLFVVDRQELVDQTLAEFSRFGMTVGCMQGENTWLLNAPVVVATSQTLARRNWPEVDLVIVDECHSIYRSVTDRMERWTGVPFIGLSATPFTKGMGKWWSDLVIGATTQQLIDDGHLCDFSVYGPPPADLSSVKTVAGDYHQGELSKAVNRKNIIGDVVKTWLSLGENRQTICFAVDIAHSKEIVSQFRAYGVEAEHIDAYVDSEDRRGTLARFARGETKIVSSVDVLTKGYDNPSASCLIMARPTKSLTVFIQQAGRVLRTCEGKDQAIILDHGGNTELHGFPSDPLPSRLCDGTKQEQDRVKKERKPKTCTKCHYVKPVGVHECPSCGFAPEKQTEVESTDDHLVRKEKISSLVKQEWYAMLLHIARSRGFRDGWAAHKYKEKFGVWPSQKSGVQTMEPSDEVLGYVKHLQIKSAKRKKPKSACQHCGSEKLYRADGKGPHKAQLRCGDCDRHIQWIAAEAA